MSLPPPPGHGIHVRTHRPNGGSRTAVNVFAFRNGGLFTAAAAQNAISAALSNTGRPYSNAKYATEWTTVSVYTLVNNAGVLTSVTTPVGNSGTLVMQTPAPATSAVITKNTGLAGRQYRGRVAYPAGFLNEAQVSGAGVIDPATVTSLQTAWDLAFADAASAGVPFCLLHAPPLTGPTPAPTLMTSFTVTNLVGSQRRRLRR